MFKTKLLCLTLNALTNLLYNKLATQALLICI